MSLLQQSKKTYKHYRYRYTSVADPGCFIPDLGSGSLDISFQIANPEPNRFIPDPTVYKKRDEK
jgi:hypothetical protein